MEQFFASEYIFLAGLVPVSHFKFKYLIVRVRRHENLQPVLMLFQYVPQVLDGFRLQENPGSNLKQDTSVRCHLKNKRLFLYLLNIVLGFIHQWNQVLKKDPNLFLNFFVIYYSLTKFKAQFLATSLKIGLVKLQLQ